MKLRRFIPNPRIPYNELVERLHRLCWGKLTKLGSVSNHPLFLWNHSPVHSFGKVVLSAGIHGDEPGGVEGVLAMLEKKPFWLTAFDLTVFPCMNPWGYEHNTRMNESDRDLNRLWRNNDSLEVQLACRVLGHDRFNLTICLHEDYDATGFYIYELTRSHVCHGPAIVKAVSRILPIESRKWIEGRYAHHGVVIRSMKSIRQRKRWPEALCHFMRYTNHTLTAETPSRFPMEKRVRSHIEVVRAALTLLRRSKK